MRLTPDEVPEHFNPDRDPNIGVLLGTALAPNLYLCAIDIDLDDEELIRRVRLAFPHNPPAKRGAKGITFFARTFNPLKSRKLTRVSDVGKRYMVLEFLGAGNQTVIPPSLHPKGMVYSWVSGSLCDMELTDLPVLSEAAQAEIELAVKDPGKNIFLLNDMTPSGGDKGSGTVHNSVLSAVASLVALGWSDDVIWDRVDLATRRADLAAGLGTERPGWENVVRKMIQDARDKGFADVKKSRPEFAAAVWIINDWRGKGRVFNLDGMIAAYRDGHYECLSDESTRRVLAQDYEVNRGMFTHNHWEVMRKTALDLAQKFPKPHMHRRRICLANGTFDLDDQELRDWSPEDYLISQLPFHFDADADCPIYDVFIQRCFAECTPEDQGLSVNTFEEFLALSLVNDLSYQKFLVLLGDPQTGKSTLVKLVKMLHDPDAVSAVGIKHLDDERYMVGMVGKLLNICNEVQATSHAADDVLKAITGGDVIEVRHLYSQSFQTVITARLMVVCNQLFRVHDTSGAVERRMMVLRCGPTIPDEERDLHLIERLREELPGIFNRITRAWVRLRERGGFLPPAVSSEEIGKFTEENNVPLMWVKARTHQGARLTDPNYQMPAKLDPTPNEILYADFAEWAKANGFKPMSSTTWGTKLGQAKVPGLVLSTSYKWLAGRSVRVRPLNLISDLGKY